MRLHRGACIVVGVAVLAQAAAVRPAQAANTATFTYWDIGGDPVIRGFDPHETIEDLEGLTGQVATPQAPLTLVTSMENTRGGFCGPLYWNPVTNRFKTYPVTGGLQVAADVNRSAPVLSQGGRTFRPGDAWFTVKGNSAFGIYVHFRASDDFRRYPGLLDTAVGIRVNQDTGRVYAAGFEEGKIVELDPATNTARTWTIGNRPWWLDIDPAGNVFTAAASGGGFPDQVVRLNPATNQVTRWDIPGGGLQQTVTFGMGNGNRVDVEGNFWFSVTAADKVGRLRPAANAIDLFTRPGLDDPNGVASSGSGGSLQTFFSERAASHVSILTPAAASPTTSVVAPSVSTLTPTTTTVAPVDFVITPFEATIPPQTFTATGDLLGGIERFPAPPGVSGPAGISRVVAPGTIYGSFEGSDHVFGIQSPAIIAPPGGCPDGPSITATITRPAAGRVYENDVDVGPSGSSAIVVRGSPLTVNVTSSNPANTSRVDFFLDGVLVGSDSTPPYSLAVPLAVAPGPHSIRVRAIQADRPICVAVDDRVIEVQCFAVSVAITRPQTGRVYQNDFDIGASGGEALVLGGNLTVQADASPSARVARVDFFLDGAAAGTDPSPPFQTVVATDPLAPGLHELRATATQANPFCQTVARRIFYRPDPSVKAVAKSVFAATNVPAEPQLHIGGALAGPRDSSDFIRIVDQPLAPVVDYLHVMTDQARGSVGSPYFAEADSLITDVSLLGGLIQADVLHAHARADLNVSNVTSATSSAGTQIVNLRIAGAPVPVAAPNTVVTIPGVGSVILQEEVRSGAGARAELTVNMIHAFVDTPSFKGEVIVGSAFAGVNLAANVFAGPETDLIHRADDAGTDTDAGSSAAGAIPIQPGVISGALGPGDDSDFYAFGTAQGERVLAVLKPAERVVTRVNPVPSVPPLPGVPQVAGVATVTGPFVPNFDLYLYDPSGRLRASSVNTLSLPERVEINADEPYAPPGARGTWTLEVRRAPGSVDAFYSLALALLPEPLADQNDAGQPGDASDLCSAARPLSPTASYPGEVDGYTFAGVIRDADQSDYYTFQANIGQLVTVALKGDEADDGADLDLYLYGPRTPGGVPECSVPIASSTNGKTIAKALPDAIVQLPVQKTGTYAIEVRRYNAVANYDVAISVMNPLPTLPQNDAGSGGDAANACAAASPALSTGLYEGTLRDVPSDDREDWYALSVAANQDITVALKPSELSNFDLELYAPGNCATPAAVGTQTLSVPEVLRIQDAAAGVWRVRVIRVSGGGNYLLGVALSP